VTKPALVSGDAAPSRAPPPVSPIVSRPAAGAIGGRTDDLAADVAAARAQRDEAILDAKRREAFKAAVDLSDKGADPTAIVKSAETFLGFLTGKK
jgi:hypothetical protein